MSGVARPGETAADFCLDAQAEFIGNVSGTWVPWNQWTEGTGGQPSLHDPFTFLTAGGPLTPAGGGGVKPPATARAGEAERDYTSFGFDWYEHIHILPRLPIEFGNILTLIEEDYEVYSAFRNDDVTLLSITNNATPGVDLPGVAPPVVMGPLSSILDPTSTDNGAGTGLGVLVRSKIQALQDGLPSFDTNVVFNFAPPANSVELWVSGSRIVFIPLAYEAPVTEVLAFLTDIIESLNGKEQRIALRKNPRQIFQVQYALDGNDRQRLQALLFDWMDKIFGFPLFHEKITLTAPTAPGATVYSVLGADEVDFRVGGFAVVMSDSATFDVLNLVGVLPNQITAADPAINGYPVGTTIMPLRLAAIRKAVEGARSINNLETLNVDFEVTDNDTGALTGTTVPGFWTIYNSRVLFDDCNVVNGDNRETFHRKVYLVDNSTGRITLTSNWDRGKRNHDKGFVLRSRAQILQFRRLLLSLAGRQKAFYVPNFIDDLEVVAPLVMGVATVDVSAIEYVRLARNRFPMNLFRITFTDGTDLIREVLNSVTVSTTVERLTLDDTWPANRAVDEVARVEFYDLVRFATDEFQISYPRIGLAECIAPVERVFDDNP